MEFAPAKDESRYKEHLKVEHRVYFYISWIIQKTLEVERGEQENRIDVDYGSGQSKTTTENLRSTLES